MVNDVYGIDSPAFSDLVLGTAQLDMLWTGGRWLEGPAYLADAGILVFSDIPNNRMLRWAEGANGSGSVTVFRQPSNYANGNTIDREFRLVTCEHGERRVTRTEKDGSVSVLADRYEGARFNSPNDVAVKSDGSVWFSDPDYGITSDYQGNRADPEIDGNHLYRRDPDGTVERVGDDFVQPNGLAFSPDEAVIYVSDTGRSTSPDGPPHMRKFRVNPDNSLAGGEVFGVIDPAPSDGFRVDECGNIWTSAGNGVHCLSPDGELLGKILVPERVSNVCFGGPKRNRLYMTGATSLFAIYLAVRGMDFSTVRS